MTPMTWILNKDESFDKIGHNESKNVHFLRGDIYIQTNVSNILTTFPQKV